jgi:hypothetical protein
VVDPETDAKYRMIIYKQGDNVSSAYRNHQKKIVDEHEKTLLAINGNGTGTQEKKFTSPQLINETLEKWIVGIRSYFNEGTKEENPDMNMVPKKAQNLADVAGSLITTNRIRLKKKKEEEAMINSTNNNPQKEVLQLKGELERKNEELRLKHEELDRRDEEVRRLKKKKQLEEEGLTEEEIIS